MESIEQYRGFALVLCVYNALHVEEHSNFRVSAFFLNIYLISHMLQKVKKKRQNISSYKI